MSILGCQSEPFSQGKRLYEVKCSNCHLSSGQGLGKEIPSLHKDVAQAAYWSCLIRHGKSEVIHQDGVSYARQMPSNPDLNAAEIANLINYIQSKWVKKSEFVGLDSVNVWLNKCQ